NLAAIGRQVELATTGGHSGSPPVPRGFAVFILHFYREYGECGVLSTCLGTGVVRRLGALSATPMKESPPQRRRDKQSPSTPPRGLASPRPTSFFPRTDAEIRSSPRHVIVGTPYARGVEAEQGPPSPDVDAEVSAPISDEAGADSTGFTLKRVTVGGEEYLAETPAVLLADSPQKKRKPRQDGTTKCLSVESC
ncbi:hypothetical protein THAOC_24520, partial [Thalassiosira oceanica]